MALSFETALRTRAPAEAIFDAVCDMDGWASWMEGRVTVVPLTSGEFGVGTQWRETRHTFGADDVECFEVTRWEPPRCFELFVDGRKGTSGSGALRFRYDVTPAGEGVEVRMHAEITWPRGLRGLLARLFARSFRKACDRDLRALLAHVEAATRPI